MSSNHATGRHYVAAGVDIIHTLAELSETVNDLVGIPGVGQIATLVKAILTICNQISANRSHAEFLGRRCHMLMVVIRKRGQNQDISSSEASSFEKFLVQTLDLVKRVQEHLIAWSHLKWRDTILMRKEIGECISAYHKEIDLCLSLLQIVTAEETAQWQREAKRAQEEDHIEIMEGIATILKNELTTIEQVTQFRAEYTQDRQANEIRWQQLTDLLQEALRQNPRDGEQQDLGRMLANVTTVTGALPSDVNISGRGREVRITSQHAVRNGENYDIYEGEYLGQFPVALKKLRNIGVKEKNFERFWRQSRIWREVWEKDQGAHILKYIGTIADDGPYPYMVSPWQKNGTILEWIDKNPACDRVKLILGVAEGVKVLHSWFPKAIVHGGIRAENILISDEGNPLLADFSLSKVLENIAGIEITNSKGVSSYYRWTAPEIVRTNTFTKQSDIFAFAMTMIEIITGEQPFGKAISNTLVVFRMQEPERLRPAQPDGADDALWDLITDCWEQDPQKRPTIEQVLSRLDEMLKNRMTY